MLLLWEACKKDEVPINPYDKVNYGGGGNPPDTVDPNSIVGLHRNIFATRCALPACHDGAFEPDYRTVESTWNTLVYHPVTKNTADTAFVFRVVPGDTSMSVLYERITNCCFININDRMPQDNIGVPLASKDINAIGTWIMNGARDWNGDLPIYPNTPPSFIFFAALDSLTATATNFSVPTNRVDSIPFYSFYMDSGVNMYFIPFVEDDSTAVADITVNSLRFSYVGNDFSTPISSLTASFLDLGGGNGLWYVDVNTAGFLMDTIVYMRYYMNDGDNPEVEWPNNSSEPLFWTFQSFIVR